MGTENQFDQLLQNAINSGLDPAVVSPTVVLFCIRPVWGWDNEKRKFRWIWFEKVVRFGPFSLLNEYQTYAGSEKEHLDKHGRYSWQETDNISERIAPNGS